MDANQINESYLVNSKVPMRDFGTGWKAWRSEEDFDAKFGKPATQPVPERA
jgi:hypothetical protein